MRVLVTGGNRGIGLEFVRQLLARGDTVFAACRTPDSATDLHKLKDEHGGSLTIVQMDVADPESVASAYNVVSGAVDALDVLINNAAINPGSERLDQVDKDAFMQTFEVNVAGVLLIAQKFVDLLARGENPRMVNISSGAGSISNGGSGMYSYRVSKAALNMFNRVLYQELKPLGIISIVMNPGWVITDMGGPNARLQPEQSIREQLEVIDNLTMDDAGSFKDHAGGELPW